MWEVVIPQKPLSGAKSRLGGSAELAGAMLRDAVAAVVAAGFVLTLLSDDASLDGLGRRVADPGGGLSAAVAAYARGVPGPVAVLMGDLPAVRAEELRTALTAAETVELGVVPDASGTGTALLTARAGALLVPSYGEGSFARHLAAGATDLLALTGDLPGLRRDVDTPADLEAALALGAGTRTRAVVSQAGFPLFT